MPSFGLGERSTVELMVLMLTATICFSLLAIGATIAVVEIIHPETDTSPVVNSLSDVLSMILGALLGLLAGKNEAVSHRHRSPPPPE